MLLNTIHKHIANLFFL